MRLDDVIIDPNNHCWSSNICTIKWKLLRREKGWERYSDQQFDLFLILYIPDGCRQWKGIRKDIHIIRNDIVECKTRTHTHTHKPYTSGVHTWPFIQIAMIIIGISTLNWNCFRRSFVQDMQEFCRYGCTKCHQFWQYLGNDKTLSDAYSLLGIPPKISNIFSLFASSKPLDFVWVNRPIFYKLTIGVTQSKCVHSVRFVASICC